MENSWLQAVLEKAPLSWAGLVGKIMVVERINPGTRRLLSDYVSGRRARRKTFETWG
jgi:hypothetical protein